MPPRRSRARWWRPRGYIPEFRLFPDPEDPLLVAELSWRGRATPAEWEHRLFGQVPQRRTHRGAFDPLPLPPGLLAVLRAGAQRDGALLRVVADDGRRAALATLVETAGQALQRVLLTCATCGVAAALHSQPLELGWLRELVRYQVSDGAFPQLILRLGLVIQTASSVRRPPADVLSAEAAGSQSLRPQ